MLIYANLCIQAVVGLVAMSKLVLQLLLPCCPLLHVLTVMSGISLC